MPTTPTYGLRYQALTDPPNGATLGQNLATDVEAQLVTTNANVATLLNQMNVFARKTANQTVNNSTTLVNDTHLSWAVVANAVYELDLHPVYSSSTVADIKFGWTFPTGLTMTWEYVGITLAGALTVAGGLTQTSVLAQGGTGGVVPVVFTGIVIVGSTAGTLRLQWAQNTAEASNTVMQTGAHGRLSRIS